jgi:hypothetical protein
MKRKLKLFIWTDFSPDYTSGLAFAIAQNEKQVRAMVTKEYGYKPYDWGTLTVHPVTQPIARAVSGGG